MIQSEITRHCAKPAPRTYPYLGVGKISGSIVLWVKPECGYIVVKGVHESKKIDLGAPVYGTNIESLYNVFEGEVTLSNTSL